MLKRSFLGPAIGAGLALLSWTTSPARAQSVAGGLALNQLEPAPAGDAFFGVASPWAAGHLVPRAYLGFDYAHRPLRVTGTGESVVAGQGFLRLDASLSLFDRVLVSVDLPFAVLQSGDDPAISGVTLPSPAGAELGDIRLGARVALLGKPLDPLQVGAGGYLHLPSAGAGSYAGEGAVRGSPHLSVGGRIPGFVYGATVGAMVRGSDNPHALTFGAGTALLLLDERLQLGPELYGSQSLGEAAPLSNAAVVIDPGSRTNAELLLGGKLRIFDDLQLGAAAGPGLTGAPGTPAFRALGVLAWSPDAQPEGGRDADGDGIPDALDACPTERGEPSGDPRRNGCPAEGVGDKDGDGIPDALDACPEVPGDANDDPLRNGCPPDRDGDGVPDGLDACPDEKGERNADTRRNGCPPLPDPDGDGIIDDDACPNEAGVPNEDPAKHGCPPEISRDRDGDGIPNDLDACPNEKGPASSDPKKHGCPREVRVTQGEIVILRQIRFRFGAYGIQDTVDPVSDELLKEVRDVIAEHPEIEKIEIQGHSDALGNALHNALLSQNRADSVRKWLIERGVPAAKLSAKGYGASMPIASNDDDDGRQKNRRVQFVIVKRRKDPYSPSP